MIKTIDVSSGETAGLYQYLSAAVTPRPIAFVGTVDKNGNKNLSPFSFFNVFSINPPILIFSPVRRVRNNTSKHTLDNVLQVKECVISLVTKNIAQQVSLSSCEFDAETNEFEKAGFTEINSDLINPPRVKESPINFECKVNDVIHLGEEGGAPPSSPKWMTSFTLHSKFIGDSFTLGGLIKSEFISVKPAFSNSFVSASNSQEDKETCWAIFFVTKEITHSFTCNTLSNVCFEVLFLTLLTGEKIKIGGLIEKTLKKEKGLKFLFPFLSTVPTNAIGLGVTAAERYWYNPAVSPELTSIVFIIF